MKRHRGRLIAVAAAAVPVLALTACAGSTSPASTQQPVNRVFTYDTTAPVMVDGWDPATEYSDGIIAISEMYETLTRYNSATNTVGPLLATSWSSADGGKTWTFHLRHGVFFHTGRPMTAQAAKAAIQRTIKLNGGASYVWAAVKTIDTPDQYTLVFHLSYASPLALQASADYSAYIYDTQGPAGQSGNAFTSWLNAGHDAGTGPYTVQTWNKGQEFEVYLKQYGKYWGGWSGSHFTKVVFRVVPQDTTAAQLLRSGQVTFIEQIGSSLWSSFKGDSSITTVSSPSWQNLLGQLNVKALSLPVRQAILYAIDYRGIIAALRGAGVVVLTFVISDVVPGDPAASWAGPHASAAQIARARQYLGLDQPLAVRIGTYFAGIVTGNWGTSIHTHRPVLSDIGTAAPATLELVIAALIIALLAGIPLGLAAARWPGHALDHAIRAGSVLGVSMPVFWLALILQLVFAQRLRLLPVAGQYDPNLVFSHPLTVRTQMAALPANLTSLTIAIAITWWPWYTRLVRGQAASAAGRPYVEACRALGIPSWRILLRHVLPNSVTPVIVQVSLDVGGVILTASALSFLGLGAQDPTPDWGLMVAEGQNYFTTQWWLVTFPGLAILLTALAFNLLGDGLRDVLDPRRVLIR